MNERISVQKRERRETFLCELKVKDRQILRQVETSRVALTVGNTVGRCFIIKQVRVHVTKPVLWIRINDKTPLATISLGRYLFIIIPGIKNLAIL